MEVHLCDLCEDRIGKGETITVTRYDEDGNLMSSEELCPTCSDDIVQQLRKLRGAR